jgi:small GTP-binding protein
MNSSTRQDDFDYSFKVLLVGDSGVGKSSLLLRFTSDAFSDISLTIGVDFKQKLMTVGGKRLKLTIWDTAGQEHFRTLTKSYYRGAQGIILVYDVTRRETLTKLADVWLEEVDVYSTSQDCIKMLIGNKVDMESKRVVSKEEGIEFARQHGCLFHECSAKTRVNVEQCFEELVLKILETPSLLEESSIGEKKNIFDHEQPKVAPNDSCC